MRIKTCNNITMQKDGEQQLFHWGRRSTLKQFFSRKSSKAKCTSSSSSLLPATGSTPDAASSSSYRNAAAIPLPLEAKRNGPVAIETAVFDANSGTQAAAFSYTNTVVQRSTPVLFCTNRGLHLRVAKPLTLAVSQRKETSCAQLRNGSTYDIQFCDLERWSTCANAVSLKDTSLYRSNNTTHSKVA